MTAAMVEKQRVPKEQAVQFTVRQVLRLLAVMTLVALAVTLIELHLGVEAQVAWQLLLPVLVPLMFLPLLYRIVLRPTAEFATPQAVVEVQEAMQGIADALQEGIVVTDTGMAVRYANRAVERMLGYPPGAMVDVPVLQLTTEKDQEYLGRQAEEYQRTGTAPIIESGPFELDVRRRDGSTLPVEVTLNRLLIYGQRLLIIILRDVSQRRLLEEMLRQSESQFRMLADTAPAMLYLTDAEQQCTYVNSRWLEFVGRKREQELGRGWESGLHPEDAPRVHTEVDAAHAAQREFRLEYRIRAADGSWRWIYDEGRPRFGTEGEFLGYIGACLDFTQRKEMEQQLRASEQRFRSLMEELPVAVRILRGREIVFANPADAAMHGCQSAKAIIGGSADAHVAPEEIERIHDYSRRCDAGEPVPPRYRMRRRREDGSEFLAEVSVAAIQHDGGPARLVVIEDLSDRERLEMFEKLLPICCVCGKIRDDHKKGPVEKRWERLDHYVAHHSDAQISHTFCPDCLLAYKKREGMA